MNGRIRLIRLYCTSRASFFILVCCHSSPLKSSKENKCRENNNAKSKTPRLKVPLDVTSLSTFSMLAIHPHTSPSFSLPWAPIWPVIRKSTRTRTARVRTPSLPIRHVDRRPRGLSAGPWPPSIITRGPGGHPPFLARRPSRE